jgi:hypothetical protein
MSSMLYRSTNYPLITLVHDIGRGAVGLPELQRPFAASVRGRGHFAFLYRDGASAATSAVMSRSMFLVLQGDTHPASYPKKDPVSLSGVMTLRRPLSAAHSTARPAA